MKDQNSQGNEPNRVPENEPVVEKKRVNRRTFLKLAGFSALATGATGALLQSCAPPNPVQNIAPGATLVPTNDQYPEVPWAPTATPEANQLKFFTPDEAKEVDALVSRIMPGSPEDPGAHEAGVVIYIDRKLDTHQNNGFVRPTYFRPPFAKPYTGDKPPAPDNDQVVFVQMSELDRYGFQSDHTPQEQYHLGLQGVNQYTNQKFGKDFVDLSNDQQDQVLTDMSEAKAKGVDATNGAAFFNTLRDDTINGMFADPAYGGNRNMVGWKLIGYPGAQRAYTPQDIHDETHLRPPQSLADLHDFHPGQESSPNVVAPPSGSEFQKTPHP